MLSRVEIMALASSPTSTSPPKNWVSWTWSSLSQNVVEQWTLMKFFVPGEAFQDLALCGGEVKIKKPWRQRRLLSQPSSWVGLGFFFLEGSRMNHYWTFNIVCSDSGAETSLTSLFQDQLQFCIWFSLPQYQCIACGERSQVLMVHISLWSFCGWCCTLLNLLHFESSGSLKGPWKEYFNINVPIYRQLIHQLLVIRAENIT